MSRISLPFSQGESRKIVDSLQYGGRVGFSIQNVGAVDIYYSDDQRTLDSLPPGTTIPTAGHLLPGGTTNIPVVYPWFVGKIFARASAAGASLEIVIYGVDKC